MLQNFSPTQGGTVKISANATPSSVDGVLSAAIGDAVRVDNAGTVLVFVRLGIGAQTATNADTPILAGASEVFDKGGATHAAVLSSTTTAADVYFTNGTGT